MHAWRDLATFALVDGPRPMVSFLGEGQFTPTAARSNAAARQERTYPYGVSGSLPGDRGFHLKRAKRLVTEGE